MVAASDASCAVKELLIGFVGAIAFSIPFFLDYLWPLWDDANRALHDMIVHTHVVQGLSAA